jgi:DNA-directed RNA polymerase specialized sigma24 family protein
LHWLGGVVWTVRRERRSRQPHAGDVSTVPDLGESIPEAILSRLDAAERVSRLPADVRHLLLWAAEGRTAVEIAAELALTAGAVRVRLHRARELARTLLGPGPDGEGTHD